MQRAPFQQPAKSLLVERERWGIEEVEAFIAREMRVARWPLKLGYTAMALATFILFGVVVRAWLNGADWLYDLLIPAGSGLLLMVVLIIPHELIHGILYRLHGAPRVDYGAEWTRLVFHASAPDFTIGYVGLRRIAFGPFILITAMLVSLIVIVGPWWQVALAMALLAHTQGCLGDMAMINFFARQDNPKAWSTVDDGDSREFVLLEAQE